MNGDHATKVVHRLNRLQPILTNGQYIFLLTNNAQNATILFRTDGLKSSDNLIEHSGCSLNKKDVLAAAPESQRPE